MQFFFLILLLLSSIIDAVGGTIFTEGDPLSNSDTNPPNPSSDSVPTTLVSVTLAPTTPQVTSSPGSGLPTNPSGGPTLQSPLATTFGASSTCADLYTLCPTWASKGECGRNSQWMNSNCPAACSSCKPKSIVITACVDLNPNCIVWATAGECFVNTGYMLWQCTKACGWCSQPETRSYPLAVAYMINPNIASGNTFRL